MNRLIKWSEKFSIGVEEVDYEHRELMSLVNDVISTMENDESVDTVLDALGELHAKVSAHFALEELVMRRRAYPDYMPHKEDHERLLDEIRDLMDAYEDGKYAETREQFLNDITEWFVHHFSTMDAKLHAMYSHD
jgi:hemerythrin